MKITIIHGQNHKGSTCYVAGELLKNITGGHEVKEFFLPKDLNHFCAGCCACIKAREMCPYWAEKEKIDTAMKEADLLILTTPTYCMAPSAPMKSFMDLFFTNWMSHKPYAEMFSKRAVGISTEAGAGAKKATEPVARMLTYWGVPKVYQYGLAVNANNPAGIPEKKKETISRDMKKLGKKISCGKSPKAGIKTRFLFRVMAGMQKADWGAGPEEKAYWKKMGWLDGKKPWK